MRGVNVIAHLAFVVQAWAQHISGSHAGNPQHEVHESGHDLPDSFVDDMVDRAFKAESLQEVDMDGTTLGKRTQIASPPARMLKSLSSGAHPSSAIANSVKPRASYRPPWVGRRPQSRAVVTQSHHKQEAICAAAPAVMAATAQLTPGATLEERVNPAGGAPRYSSSEWLKDMMTLPVSVVLRRIGGHLAFNIAIASAVVAAQHYGYLTFALPALPHTMLGGFLSLLLVFRTNAAYGRFWEGRGLWGQINNWVRNLATSAAAYVRPVAPAESDSFIKALIAYPYSVADACLSKPGTAADPFEKCTLMQTALAAASAEGEKVFKPSSPRAYMYSMQLSRMANIVGYLCDSAGGLGKITNTPVPLSYSRHTSRFLTIWAATLPLVLAPMFKLWTVPIVGVVCWFIFGIEEIGHLIEQPFSDPKITPWNRGMPVVAIAKSQSDGVIFHYTESKLREQAEMKAQLESFAKPA
eukprot:gnl/TRDRNA2_/TRDRNA2_169103_c1_seq1.p1 gnl/TRDRNA2_/TRDRNA2_169103_c1~~gnl/TRDRNA2_/TRDRNA2_169103_c1_seq1.p1  ORF type:complete len:483 (+),score=41.28 gnl/TRDRNA2_/TRDRNA2_169103_c1_seq1:48-1451(+)